MLSVLCCAMHVKMSVLLHLEKLLCVDVGTSGRRARWSSDIRLLALDMDGTLLDSNSKVLPSSVKAIKVTQLSLHASIICSLTKRVNICLPADTDAARSIF